MQKLENDAALKVDFFGKEYVFERVNPFTVRISNGILDTVASFPGELFEGIKKN